LASFVDRGVGLDERGQGYDPRIAQVLVAFRRDGTRAPLFCFHAVGGNVLNYRRLLEALHPEQPLYGVQALGLDGRSSPLDSIEAMSSLYLRAVKSVQPNGPYLLAGGSLGGVLAFEVAQQMRREGDAVGMLLMFDSMGPNYGTGSDLSPSTVLDRLSQRSAGRPLLRVISAALAVRARDLVRRVRCRTRLACGLPLGHEDRHWYVEQVNRRAVQRYVPSVYPGKIHLIRGSMEENGFYSDPERGWSGWAEAGIVSVGVDGRHESLIEAPGFGRCLRQLLDSAAS
jgi:thioesterase domain-containing protein